ncbi:MAG: hypothetical protein M3436_19455 [Pseudomonadota bacterium]|nr:hypothetical protein [Pseudomonadota bacterium]
MTQTTVDRETLKQTLKEALSETLHEERELLHEVFVEVLEDFALGKAVREGLETQPATREDIFNVLEGQE